MNTRIVVSVVLLAGLDFGQSQGFTNLDFEKATIVAGPGGFGVITSNAISGWTAYINGTAQTVIGYNTISLDTALVSIHDTNDPFGSYYSGFIQGRYSILLQPSGPPFFADSAAIGQTGTVPLTAESLQFDVSAGGQISAFFSNQQISLSVLGTGPNYTIYGGDISTFSGQTGQLLFQGGGVLDNIQFSSLPIPEPSTLALTALGGLLLGFRRWRNSSR